LAYLGAETCFAKVGWLSEPVKKVSCHEHFSSRNVNHFWIQLQLALVKLISENKCVLHLLC